MHKSYALESMEIAQSMTKYLLTKSHSRTQIQFVMHMVTDAVKAHIELMEAKSKNLPSHLRTVIPNGAPKMDGSDDHDRASRM